MNEAQAAFEKVLASGAEGKSAQLQRALAKLGKASVLVATKKSAEAISLVEDIISNADPKDAPLLARAYNILGTAQRETNHPKDAILAFLHVDCLYSTVPEAHAEALANLVELWEQVHKTERANQARKTLEEDYQNSPWTKKVTR
jgi:hypothetical protein